MVLPSERECVAVFPASLGFGTAGFDTSTQARESVQRAIATGYRHFDSARHYSHSSAVGAAIVNSAVPTEDISVASKIHSKDLDYESLLSEAKVATNELDLDFLDILYVHWPAHAYEPEETFAAIDDLIEQGQIRHAGVCNFTRELLREALTVSSTQILVNQVEMHPFLQQDDLLTFCQSEGVHMVAHTPLAGGLVFESTVLREIAESYNATIPQIVLAWLTNRENVSAIPKATGKHIEENYDATMLSLTEQDINKIESIQTEHRVVDYEFAPWNQ